MLRRISTPSYPARRHIWSRLKFTTCSPIVRLSCMPLWTMSGYLHWRLGVGKVRFPLTINMGHQNVDRYGNRSPINTQHGLYNLSCTYNHRIRASLLYDFLARISRDFYETILVGKFPSREISEKCASHRSRIIDIQSFLPLHRT